MNEEKSLSEIYGENTNFRKIILSSDGIEIQGKKLKNVIPDSIDIAAFGNKTMVACCFVCDEFSLIPSDSSD